jgi:hypothetical protein
MKKTRIATIYAILLLTSLLVASQSYGEITVNASNAGLIYAPNYNVDELDDYWEEGNTTAVCNYIYDLFDTYGENYYWFGVDCTANYYEYYADAFYVDTYYDNVAFFTKGHASGYSHGALNHHFLMDRLGEMVQDNVYGQYVDEVDYQVVFIWHCGTAQDYVPNTSMFCSTCNGYVSFPMALTKDNSLSLDGFNSTTGNHVFVGFHGYSPQFLSNWGLTGAYQYFHFVSLVYLRLLQYQDTIHEAINYASNTCSGEYYPESWLAEHKIDFDPDGEGFLPAYSTWMEIFGNGNLGVPG